MGIRVESLTHTYQPGSPFQATAIRDVNLDIADGELLAVIGHTGSGKSTLAQHLNALLKPTAGRVLLDGKDINARETDRRAVRFRVGLVFQYPEHQLFEETVARDIGFGPKNMGLSQTEVDSRVREAMDRMGLAWEEFKDKSPFELSGGQMRRVALAGVLAMRPGILVLDEPAAGLDPRGRDFLIGDIRRLHGEGTTVVLISHSMDDVARLADRVAVMEQGAVVMEGTPREIFAREERLSAMGLDVPQVVRLGHRLRTAGIPVPECIRPEEMARALAALLGKAEPHAT